MFLSEKDLVKKFKSNYSLVCSWDTKANKTKIIEEVNLGFGIADLVISKMKTIPKNKKGSLNYFDFTVYKIIEDSNGISLESIRDITKSDSSTIKKSLSKLMLDSYVKECDMFYTLTKAYTNCFIDTVAIEAKLKNWKRALNQAYRYKWFASASYVVLDEKNINGALTNIDQFEKMNVGLASIDKIGNVIVIHKPIAEKPIDEKMQMLLSERILSNYLDKRKDFQIAK
jgi:hypothetical protein